MRGMGGATSKKVSGEVDSAALSGVMPYVLICLLEASASKRVEREDCKLAALDGLNGAMAES